VSLGWADILAKSSLPQSAFGFVHPTSPSKKTTNNFEDFSFKSRHCFSGAKSMRNTRPRLP
jgi:hypothetical protein